jgi:two-component system sensor histidine kinase UhpB
MHGTLLCAIVADDAAEDAMLLGVQLSERLGLRLVLAHPIDGRADAGETGRASAERRLAELADRFGVAGHAEQRILVGDPAARLGQVAAEEAADVIVLPGVARGWGRRLDPGLARELETETPVPVVIAPPRRRGRRRSRQSMEPRRLPLFWRVFAVNAGVLVVIAVLLLVTPITISAPVALAEAGVVVAGLVVTVAANAVLLRRAFAPLGRLAARMEMVDLLRPGQRLDVVRSDEVGRLVATFNQMLDRLEHERRESASRVLAAQEAERVGIARDLHDEVGQVLTGVLLQLNSMGASAPALRVELDEARQSVRRALDEVRRISSELRPEMLEHLGLVSALTELATSFARVSGIDVKREFAADVPKLAPEVELAIYRIAQESLTNVARHAGATRVTVSLDSGRGSLVLRVADDGRGFDGPPAEHGGLRSMRERALLVGGALAVKGGTEGGAEVRLEVPAG